MLEQNIPFAEKVEKIMDYKYAKISHLGKSFFSLSALEDEEFKEVIREAAYIKAVPIYTRFIEQGKKEGFIAREIPTQTILTFIFQIMPILECKDYQESSEENKRGILNLILYGIIGRKPG